MRVSYKRGYPVQLSFNCPVWSCAGLLPTSLAVLNVAPSGRSTARLYSDYDRAVWRSEHDLSAAAQLTATRRLLSHSAAAAAAQSGSMIEAWDLGYQPANRSVMKVENLEKLWFCDSPSNTFQALCHSFIVLLPIPFIM